MSEVARSLSARTTEELERTVATVSGERLSAEELATIDDRVSNGADRSLRQRIETVSALQTLLSDVRDVVRTIGEALDVVRGHSVRSAEAVDVVSSVLDRTLRRNDSELNVTTAVFFWGGGRVGDLNARVKSPVKKKKP